MSCFKNKMRYYLLQILNREEDYVALMKSYIDKFIVYEILVSDMYHYNQIEYGTQVNLQCVQYVSRVHSFHSTHLQAWTKVVETRENSQPFPLV